MVDLGDTGNRSGRWVCPNDRHLALRAKLRTGWSVKTGSLDYRSSDYPSGPQLALTEEERCTIIEVIRRAEALDLSEQERVGRLVDRLENMKRNCVSSGNLSGVCGGGIGEYSYSRYSCALCGERFTVLGSGPAICKDCRKHICQKCGIEATIMPCGGGGGTQLGFTQNSQRPPRLFLCRICSETREMWKKSGAWFFKGLPKYVLPEKKVERGRPRRTSRASSWAVVNNLRPLETGEPGDSSSDEDAGRRLALSRSFGASGEVGPSTPTAKEKSGRSGTPVFGPGYSRQNSSNAGDFGSINGANKSVDGDQSGQFSPSSSSQPLCSQSPRVPGTTMTARNFTGFQSAAVQANDLQRIQSSSDQLNSNQVHSFRRESLESSYSSQGQLMQNFDTNTKIFEQNIRHREMEQQLNQIEISSTIQNNESNGTINNHNKYDTALQQIARASAAGDGYGTLEASLLYDPAAQYLQCRVQRARGLRPMDIHGLTDSFCKLNILPVAIGSPSQRLRTKTVHKTRDPEYNEMVTFYGITETDMKNGRTLHILVLQDDPAGKDFLGEAKLPLYQLQPYQTIHYNVYLESHCQVDNEEDVWGEDLSPRGRILVTLSYSTRRRALLVTVLRAVNLQAMDSNGLSDPFVKVYMIKRAEDSNSSLQQQQTTLGITNNASNADNKKSKEPVRKHPTSAVHSTGIKWKTLNPEWNEEFAFETRLTDLTSQILCLSVWDKDFGKSNDYLGGLLLSCNSKGERLRQWIDAIKFPDHRHQAWHSLQEDPIPTE